MEIQLFIKLHNTTNDKLDTIGCVVEAETYDETKQKALEKLNKFLDRNFDSYFKVRE
jgi:hypothetical protein